VVDADQLEALVVDGVHDPNLVAALDPVVERTRLVGLSRVEASDPIAGTGEDAAGLVREPGAGVRDDLVAHRRRDHHQTRSSISRSS
jgi:hypothetical protein